MLVLALEYGPCRRIFDLFLRYSTHARCYSDFADQFPSATVIGTDLSPIQPLLVPPNCRFEIDDAATQWLFPKDFFNFIHIRGLYGCISDWPALYREVYKYASPVHM